MQSSYFQSLDKCYLGLLIIKYFQSFPLHQLSNSTIWNFLQGSIGEICSKIQLFSPFITSCFYPLLINKEKTLCILKVFRIFSLIKNRSFNKRSLAPDYTAEFPLITFWRKIVLSAQSPPAPQLSQSLHHHHQHNHL